MSHLLALDVGGSAVKASLASRSGGGWARTVELPTERPDPMTAELDPDTWWLRCCRAVADVVTAAGITHEPVAVVVSSLRQGFVLVDDDGEVGPGVLNSDRRGSSALPALIERIGRERLYATTGHWSAPELTLPKLMHLAQHEPERLSRARHMLFVHDWLVWRLTGEVLTEATLAASGQLLDVSARTWALDLLAEVGVPARLLPGLRAAGDLVGPVRPGPHGLPAGSTVHVGGADTMLAALGAGGLVDGTVTVVAGSSTPVQVAVDRAAHDPAGRAWLSPHLRAGTWAAETNCGYPGTLLARQAKLLGLDLAEAVDTAWTSPPGAHGVTAATATAVWDEAHWADRAPHRLSGFAPATTAADVLRAHLEAHAFGIRACVEDLARAVGRADPAVILTGRPAQDPRFAGLVADVLGRSVTVPGPGGAVLAAAALLGRSDPDVVPAGQVVAPVHDPDTYREPWERFRALVAVPATASGGAS